MSSRYERKCRTCDGTGEVTVNGTPSQCARCWGAGEVQRPVTVPVKVKVDNRSPQEFTMAIHPDGRLTFRRKGHRTVVATSVQAAFNRAQQETAAAAIADRGNAKKQRRRRVSRGLLTHGR